MENIDPDYTPGNKINFRSVLGFVVSGIFLWLMFYKSGLHLSDIRLHGIEWFYFIAAIGVFVMSLGLYAIRAQVIWGARSRNGARVSTYSSLILGNFYNCILPGNLGEGVRAWHFSKKNGVPFSRSLAEIITEKWTDALVFALLVILLFLIKPFESHFILYALAYTAAAVFFLCIVHIILLTNRTLEKRIWLILFLFKRVGKFLYKVYAHTNDLLKGIWKNGNVSTCILLFAVIFSVNMSQFFFLQKAAGVAAPVSSIYSSFLISLSMMIIAFIPSAPSNIGVLHYGVYSALILAARQQGVEPDQKALQSYALFAIYVHLSFLIPEVILGGIMVIKERRKLFPGTTKI